MEDLSERKLTQIILSQAPSARSLETTELILARNRFRRRRVLEVLCHLHIDDIKDVRAGAT
jgi:hypothetical protein